MTSDPTDARSTALRQILVDRAATPRAPRSRMSRRGVVATVAAFTLAGGLTGGAVSAVAGTSLDGGPTIVDVDQLSARASAVGDSTLLGTPVSYTGTGETVLELGIAPAGATEFVYSFRCLDAADYNLSFNRDSLSESKASCDQEAASSPFGGGGGQFPVAGEGPQTMTINSSGRYVIWGSWAQKPTPPEPSTEQSNALADGTVTEQEYRAGYQRFSACMAEAGFPLAFVDDSGTVINYSTTQAAETDGASSRCYVREFGDVDEAWQIANEDTSETAEWLGACLLARGITPGATMTEKTAQLEAAGIDVMTC